MMKYWLYFLFFLLFACQSFEEESDFLEPGFYLQDGWLAFMSGNYSEAKDLFNTVRDVDNDPLYHFLSYVALGWAHTYHAKSLLFSNEDDRVEGLRDSAGVEYQNAVELLFNELQDEIINDGLEEGMAFLYAGGTLHYFYLAKHASVNEEPWAFVDSLYMEVLNLSEILLEEIAPDFNFPYD